MDQYEWASPIAEHLLAAYANTAEYRWSFLDEHGLLPTTMAKTHHMRSVALAKLTFDDRYELEQAYSELGRVRFLDIATGRSFQLRSERHLTFQVSEQLSLLPSENTPQLLTYRYSARGLTLGLADSVVPLRASSRLIAITDPVAIGTWGFNDFDLPTFEQGSGDLFADVGALDADEGGLA